MNRAIWVLAWPILAESMLNSLVGLTDTVLAAQISAAATDAIGAAAYVMWFVGLIAMAVGVGATALVSRAMGGGRTAVAHAATAQALLLSAVSGVVTGGLIAAAAGPAAGLMSLTPEAQAAFKTYVRIVAVGVPALSIMSAGIACARGAGDSIRPLGAMVAVNVINIAASWTLAGRDYVVTRWEAGSPRSEVLLRNPSRMEWGISGVAWGTVIAECVGAVLVIALLVRGSSGVVLLRRRLRPHAHTLRRLVRVGLPNFLEMLGMWAGNFVIILIVGRIASRQGEGVIGSHIVAVRIESFSFLPGLAMGTAAAALVGQYLGAGSPALARAAALRCTLIASIFMGAAGAVFVCFPERVVGMVTSQASHLALAPELMFITGFIQIPFGIALVLRSALRGAGDSAAVMWIMWACTYVVRIPLAYVLARVDLELPGGVLIPPILRGEPSLAMLWAALCVEIVIRMALLAARFAQGHWTSKRV